MATVVEMAKEGFAALDRELGIGGDDAAALLTRIRDRRAAAAGIEAEWVEAQIQARTDARAGKDFAEADRIRDELAAKGVELHDAPEGTTWTVS